MTFNSEIQYPRFRTAIGQNLTGLKYTAVANTSVTLIHIWKAASELKRYALAHNTYTIHCID